MSRKAIVIAAVVLAGVFAGAQVDVVQSQIREVIVRNFPATQNVNGTVNVGNLPAVQTVTGTVSVDSIPASPPAARFQLVGFTAATFTGDQGVFSYTAQCESEFGLSSRMCLLIEAWTTTSVPPLDGGAFGAAWVNTTRDIPGTNLNCGGWGAGGEGTALNEDGSIRSIGCDAPLGIACCAPA